MKGPIKVLVLTDGIIVNKWVADIIQFITGNSSFTLSAVVVNTAKKSSYSSLGYRLLRLADRKIFKARTNPFQSITLKLDSDLIYYTHPLQKQFSDWLDEDCIKYIKNKNPDLILRFGFRILRGDVLGIPKLGIWSLHHGDNKVNRGGPPGFWEVVRKESVSGVTLQQITEDLDGGKVIGRAYTKTDFTSFHRNQVNIFEVGVRLFQEKLNQLSQGKFWFETSDLDFYSFPLYKNPKNWKSIQISIDFAFHTLKRLWENSFYHQQWLIKYSKNNDGEESIYRFKDLVPPKGISWADPFPVVHNNKLYLFAEEIDKNNRGKIVCFEYLPENNSFDSPKTVIKKNFHLSYPHVFTYDNKWYMIPETGNTGQVILFKAEDFPFQWKEEKIISQGKKLYDVTPFQREGKWYAFASERIADSTTPNDLLLLYSLKNGPLGKWELHPASPIKMDVRGGRSAGKIFEKNGVQFRPAQLGTPKYGYAIQIYEIVQLDEDNYEERLIETLLPEWDANVLATHTINFAEGRNFIDYQRLVRKF